MATVAQSHSTAHLSWHTSTWYLIVCTDHRLFMCGQDADILLSKMHVLLWIELVVLRSCLVSLYLLPRTSGRSSGGPQTSFGRIKSVQIDLLSGGLHFQTSRSFTTMAPQRMLIENCRAATSKRLLRSCPTPHTSLICARTVLLQSLSGCWPYSF